MARFEEVSDALWEIAPMKQLTKSSLEAAKNKKIRQKLVAALQKRFDADHGLSKGAKRDYPWDNLASHEIFDVFVEVVNETFPFKP